MRRVRATFVLATAVTVGAIGGYWYAGLPAAVQASVAPSQAVPTAERKIIYYRDPSGAPFWSATPKKDAQGRDYRPVYDNEDVSFDPQPKKPPQAAAAGGERKIRYYRNPMGLPDTSPVPKKDSMGMDYIAVYEGEAEDDGNTVKISLGKVQRTGVRTEPAELRILLQPTRAIGTVAIDERRQNIVTLRSDGYIEDLFVNTTGQAVKAGEPLFRVYSAQIQQAQTDLISAMRAMTRGVTGPDADRELNGAMQRLRNLGVPESRIREVRETGANPRTIDWPAPADGVVIGKRIINGQRVAAGEELYRIVDLSQVWVIADVAEADLAAINPGTRAIVTFRAFAAEPIPGKVTFIYPELKPETRTARVRIELPNPDGRLRADMYADVVFRTGDGDGSVISVPVSAIIDSGTRQVVLIAKGEGRFEPRPVKLGRRGEGHVEILEGVEMGEEVVTTATFLIDAESNLRAALKAFAQPETPK
ncbi:MAG: efflux RND transporter periplasmic adaptor subunit [Rhizobiales bacterium]|nr:efflux RND transporter periplasmic adaptor subunit [Hyphomicrobiales bacterium]